jgi:hypothetical protein
VSRSTAYRAIERTERAADHGANAVTSTNGATTVGWGRDMNCQERVASAVIFVSPYTDLPPIPAVSG